MARRRFEDDDEYDDRPRRRESGGEFPWKLVLGILGGLVVIAVVVCGGLMLLGYRQAAKMQDRMMVQMEAERAAAEAAQAQAQAARADADMPVPDGPPPQPAAGQFDSPGDAGRWVVLFRSADPALWNTTSTAGDDFAIPLKYAPQGTTFLRLRRLDTGETVIVPMTRGRVGKADPEGKLPRWNGGNQDEHGGRHLGLATGPSAKWQDGKGTVAVLMDGWDATGGSGFGHGHHVDDGGQKYAWKGKEIGKTAFEVAVTAGELTDKEKASVAK